MSDGLFHCPTCGELAPINTLLPPQGEPAKCGCGVTNVLTTSGIVTTGEVVNKNWVAAKAYADRKRRAEAEGLSYDVEPPLVVTESQVEEPEVADQVTPDVVATPPVALVRSGRFSAKTVAVVLFLVGGLSLAAVVASMLYK